MPVRAIRIVAGKYRGRRIGALPGAAVRPTADRVREALFDILAHGRWAKAGGKLAGARVLDLFAGTGALGFEALSRGAAQVTFIDDHGAALRLIERNAAQLGVSDQTSVLGRDATRLGPAPGRFRLVFLDPPYNRGLGPAALDALGSGDWLEPGALAVVQLSRREAFAPPAGFTVIDDRRYGATRLVLLGWSP